MSDVFLIATLNVISEDISARVYHDPLCISSQVILCVLVTKIPHCLEIISIINNILI